MAQEPGIKKTINWIVGVVIIALVLLISLIVFGNLSGNVGIDTTQRTAFTNESGFLNNTGYTPTGVSSVQNFLSYSISEVWGNASTTAYLIPPANYTKVGNAILNGTTLDFEDYGYDDATITYLVTSRSNEFNEAEALIDNYTAGAGQLASQFPTVMLFIGIALLLFVLIGVLAWVIKNLSGLGGGGKMQAGFN